MILSPISTESESNMGSRKDEDHSVPASSFSLPAMSVTWSRVFLL